MRNFLGHVNVTHLERADFAGETGQLMEGPRRSVETRVFDREGREIEVILYNRAQQSILIDSIVCARGDSIFRETKAYDERGNLSRIVCNCPDGSVKSKTSFSYDSDERPALRLHYDAIDNLTEKGVYEYDLAEGFLEFLLYDANESLKAKILFDPTRGMDKPEKEIIFNPDGTVQSTTKSVFDSKNNLIERGYYKAENSLDHKIAYIHDRLGNEVEQLWYGSDGMLFRKFIKAFDDEKRVVRNTEVQVEKGTEETYLFTYEVDSVGNWIRKTMLRLVSKDAPSSYWPGLAHYRTITYW
jgi:hypothetical protein